jgi:hypothetical protein
VCSNQLGMYCEHTNCMLTIESSILLSDILRIYLCFASVLIIMPDVDACYESYVRQRDI